MRLIEFHSRTRCTKRTIPVLGHGAHTHKHTHTLIQAARRSKRSTTRHQTHAEQDILLLKGLFWKIIIKKMTKHLMHREIQV